MNRRLGVFVSLASLACLAALSMAGNASALALDSTETLPAEAAVTVDPQGVLTRSGTATIGGNFTCANADIAFLDLIVSQQKGRFQINTGTASLDDLGPCDGVAHPWSATVIGSDGRFTGGPVSVDARLAACGPLDCASDEVLGQNVVLRGR